MRVKYCVDCQKQTLHTQAEACASFERRILVSRCTNCGRHWVMGHWKVDNELVAEDGRKPRWEEQPCTPEKAP